MKTMNRISLAWKVLKGKELKESQILEQDVDKLIANISKSSGELSSKYSEKIYNIVDVGIANDKIKIVHNGIDDIIFTMVESINLHLMHELENILKKIDEPNSKVPSAESAERRIGK